MGEIWGVAGGRGWGSVTLRDIKGFLFLFSWYCQFYNIIQLGGFNGI